MAKKQADVVDTRPDAAATHSEPTTHHNGIRSMPLVSYSPAAMGRYVPPQPDPNRLPDDVAERLAIDDQRRYELTLAFAGAGRGNTAANDAVGAVDRLREEATRERSNALAEQQKEKSTG